MPYFLIQYKLSQRHFFPGGSDLSFEWVASSVSVQHLVTFPSSYPFNTFCSSTSDTLFKAFLKVSDLNYDD